MCKFTNGKSKRKQRRIHGCTKKQLPMEIDNKKKKRTNDKANGTQKKSTFRMHTRAHEIYPRIDSISVGRFIFRGGVIP